MVDEQSFVFYEPPMLVEASEAKFDAKVGAVEEEMEDSFNIDSYSHLWKK